MTIEQSRKWGLGQSYWLEYVRMNGYAVEANKDGLRKLSKNLDLNILHLRECINLYLEIDNRGEGGLGCSKSKHPDLCTVKTGGFPSCSRKSFYCV
jgi:hypothetical protein